MEFFDVLERRHCCRRFNSRKPITEGLLSEIIRAGKLAPSAGGIYPVDFTVIKDEKTKEALADVTPGGTHFITEAPLVLIVWADIEKTEFRYGERGRQLYVIQDAAAAAENIFLAVTALGLNTCWIGAFDEEGVSKLLGLKENQRPMVIMPIGYEQ